MFNLYLHLVNISAFANVSSYILQIRMYSYFCSRFMFANAKSNSFVIRYPSAYVYMHITVCHNLARSAFCSIQSARRFSTCPLLSRRGPQRESWRFKEREEETGSRYCRQKSSHCWFHKEDQSRKSRSEKQTSSWLFVFSFVLRAIGSFATRLLFERQDD